MEPGLRSFVRDRLLLTALVCTMGAVLLILAVLQYRWSRQVREANEVRIGENLRSQMMDWHADLLHEFSSIAVSLQVSPDSGARDDWHDYVERFAEWKKSSPHAALVSDLLLWETSGRPARLARFDPERMSVGDFQTPASLQRLLDRLQSRSENLEEALEAWKLHEGAKTPAPAGGTKPADPGRRADPMSGWQFDATIPALVHPVVHHALPNDVGSGDKTGTVDWLIVVLDMGAFRTQVLPSLTQRHFDGEGGPEYDITVTSGEEPARILYTSESDSKRHTPEVQMSIFGPPPEVSGGHVWKTAGNGRYLQRSEWRNLSAPTWFPTLQYGENERGWQLLLQHRQGSLESALESIRQRNLVLSYGILGLLAASMSLVLLASQRAHRLARLQMDFVATVSHELRTPLAVIQSAAENISDGVVGGNEQVNRYGKVIRNQTRQLSDLVEQILSFAATRDGKVRYRIEELSVSEILQVALGNTEDMIRQAGFKLETVIEPELPAVRGDRLAIAQCLQNLIINAVKYGGEQRWIRVEAKLAPGGPDEVRILVSDRGMGIKQSEVEQIFEPFYRSTSVHEVQIHGTGLGLPLARSIAEAMNRRLSVQSDPGRGSTFTLHLPVSGHRKIRPSATGAVPAVELRHE
jgi:signal transduction histidine kinase